MIRIRKTICYIIRLAGSVFVFIALSAACSCGAARSGATASDLVCGAIASLPELDGEYTVYCSGADPSGEGFLTDAELYALYYGADADLHSAGELSGVDGWCVAISRSPVQRELHVLRLAHRSDEQPVCDMLRARQRRISRPDPAPGGNNALPFGGRADDVQVFVCGSFAVFCACPDCSPVADWLNNHS